jgi:hypothetical protein
VNDRTSWPTIRQHAPSTLLRHSQDIGLDGGTGSLDALDDGLGELLDVTPGRVEGNGNDGLGPGRVSSRRVEPGNRDLGVCLQRTF